MTIDLGNSNRHFCSSGCKFGVALYSQKAKKWEGRDSCPYLSALSVLGITVGPGFMHSQGAETQQQVFCFQKSLDFGVIRAAKKLFSVR